MASTSRSVSRRGRLFAWFDRRLPIQALLDTQLTGYYAPKNLSAWYYFGALALLLLGTQFLTGIFLATFYKPGEFTSFDSVQYIMREGPGAGLSVTHTQREPPYSSSSCICTCSGGFFTARTRRRVNSCGLSECSYISR